MEQRKTGEVTITDERMTRFWISLEQGIRFVIRCIERMHGGEVFVPKVPSMSVLDLALAVAPEAKVKIVGIRPGEKLHEILVTEEEARRTQELDDAYVITPEFSFWNKENWKEGKPVPADFSYRSDRNERNHDKKYQNRYFMMMESLFPRLQGIAGAHVPPLLLLDVPDKSRGRLETHSPALFPLPFIRGRG